MSPEEGRIPERRFEPRIRPPAAGRLGLCVVLHDCAPARSEGCEQVLKVLNEVSARVGVELALTLLVVPRWHGQVRADPKWIRRLQALVAEGHELALHGWTHLDTGPPPRGPLQWVARRLYTDSEGEFSALDFETSSALLKDAAAWARSHGLVTSGFVAPAWMMSPPALRAIVHAGFSHTCTLSRIVALPGGQSLSAPALVYSTRAPWRRVTSVLWNLGLAAHFDAAPLLRLDLHPDDARHEAVREAWSSWLGQALRRRVPLRLSEAANLARTAG